MLLATAIPAQATSSSPACLGGASPLLRLMGVPAHGSMPLLQDGALSARVSLELANHANRSESRDSLEAIELDGETYYLDFALRYGLNDRLTVGIDVPIIRHSTGVLDKGIEQWLNSIAAEVINEQQAYITEQHLVNQSVQWAGMN